MVRSLILLAVIVGGSSLNSLWCRAADVSESKVASASLEMMQVVRDEHRLVADHVPEVSESQVTSASIEMMQVVRDEHRLVADMVKTQLASRGGDDQFLPKHAEESRKTISHLERPTRVQVYLLLGGLVGPDGTVTSAGMFQLAKMLRELPDTEVFTYTWNRWTEAYKAILANEGKAKIVVIGYSGGGSRATWLANMPSKPQIDLMIYYDPSPSWQMKSINTNVKKALCYHNTTPMMWVPGIGDLGGGQLVGKTLGSSGEPIHGPSIETIDIAEQHLLVQVDQSLHQRTVEAVRALTSAAPTRSDPALALAQNRRAPHGHAFTLARRSREWVHFSVADSRDNENRGVRIGKSTTDSAAGGHD
jgi:pimeloyl-ACP methyl ester carboxylesterase